MKKYGMVHDDNLCIGCQACNIACRSENKIPDSVYRLQVWIKPKKYSNSTMGFEFHRQSCVHCENAPCVSVCPTKASFKNSDGIVLINENLCVGCLYCVAACPYRARYVNPITKAPDKCTFCHETRLGRGEEPACVSVCPTSAFVFCDWSDPKSEINQTLANKTTYRQKEELGTDPKMFIVADKRGGIKS